MSLVMCATADDEPRIREIIQKMVDNDEVTNCKAFTSKSKKKKVARKKKADREAKMGEKILLLFCCLLQLPGQLVTVSHAFYL